MQKNLLKNYENCVFCKSKIGKKKNYQIFEQNFYIDAIVSDLDPQKKNINKIKSYKCDNCKIIQNNPWFSEEISKKIYNEVYGQHNRNWQNIINYFNKGKLPDHGILFDILNKYIKIKNYAEFNSPFMGLMINFFAAEYNQSLKIKKKFFANSISYLNSRQVAGEKRVVQFNSQYVAKKNLKKILNFKKKKKFELLKTKNLFVDNSNLCWGQNDNYKSVNSKSLASLIFDIDIKDIRDYKNKLKHDLFGIFHTLDHTFNPKRILEYALNSSKYVIVYCHVNKNLSSQHLFSITEEFLKHLEKNNIETLKLNNFIQKNFKSPELYFLCSKNKNLINKIKMKLY